MSKYKVTSKEGAERYDAEVGETVDLELNESDERAQVCAGWLAPAEKKKEVK